MKHTFKILAKLIMFVAIIAPMLLRADVKLPAVFADHMVLQQNADAKLWGSADPGERIQIMASWGAELAVQADSQGNWKTALPTPAGSHTPQQIIFKGKNEVFLRNVLIGEVWLCSGQSNMAWTVKNSNNAYEEFKNAKYPSIRFFHIPNTLAWEPQEDVNAQWEVCTPENTIDKSAIAYFFGRNLRKELDVPVGLIISAWGGSGVQAWIDKGTAAQEGHQEIVDWYDEHEAKLKEYRFNWIKTTAEWRANQKEGEEFNWASQPKRNLPGDQHIPFALYNGMIHPIKTFSIKGALWYQGESNVQRAHQYRTLFPAMIKSWRNAWGQGNFPFYYVQIAPYHYNDFEGIKSAELRDAQLKTLGLVKNTGMVVITDIAQVNDIHPRGKQPVGKRLAMLALHNDYKKWEGEYTSPLNTSHKIEGNTMVLNFSHAQALKVRGVEIVGIKIAGKDQKFIKAKAEIINGNQLKVWSNKVKRPVAVRFGWSNALVTNLYNEINLPVSPFKTDNWKDTTEGEIHLDFP